MNLTLFLIELLGLVFIMSTGMFVFGAKYGKNKIMGKSVYDLAFGLPSYFQPVQQKKDFIPTYNKILENNSIEAKYVNDSGQDNIRSQSISHNMLITKISLTQTAVTPRMKVVGFVLTKS